MPQADPNAMAAETPEAMPQADPNAMMQADPNAMEQQPAPEEMMPEEPLEEPVEDMEENVDDSTMSLFAQLDPNDREAARKYIISMLDKADEKEPQQEEVPEEEVPQEPQMQQQPQAPVMEWKEIKLKKSMLEALRRSSKSERTASDKSEFNKKHDNKKSPWVGKTVTENNENVNNAQTASLSFIQDTGTTSFSQTYYDAVKAAKNNNTNVQIPLDGNKNVVVNADADKTSPADVEKLAKGNNAGTINVYSKK